MKKILSVLLLIPFAAFSAIPDWDYLPFISYSGQSPAEIIGQGRNFELLEMLWKKPQPLRRLQKAGLDLADVDTALLARQGMIYRKRGRYHSAIPFIDSLAANNLRGRAAALAERMVGETRPQMKAFLSALDRAGCTKSAFSLVHSLVFDDLIWRSIGVSKENSTVCSVDGMTWSGTFYFYRPVVSGVYGTNGMGLDDKHLFKFAWGNNSNAYLCTVFIKTRILKALRCLLNGEDLSDEMMRDCRRFGVFDEQDRLTVPILDGTDEISRAADVWAKAAAESFAKYFDGASVADAIGWTCDYNEAALKVILYHETLSKIDGLLDETGLLPIPEILTSEIPADRTQTASVAYVTRR